jgi:uncharacterized membrane protein SpoIIM required for sporulation
VSRPRSVAAFVRERRAAWERLDALAARAATGKLPLAEVEELDRLFRRAAGDLAHARTAFPGSDAEGFLAQVATRAYGVLHRPRARRLAALAALYRDEAPAAFRAHRGAFALALAALATGLAGGALAVALDPSAAAALVPAPVRDAVAAGRLWTDGLLSVAPGLAGSAILHNNLGVAALAFALGLTAGLGTAALLFVNGLSVGAIVVHAAQGGLGPGLLGFVAAHGPLELGALLLAGQAGLVLASGLVDPGEWPRRVALAARGREAARLLAVALPALGAAAAVEATVSPGALLPAAAKALLGIALAAAPFLWLARAGPPRAA